MATTQAPTSSDPNVKEECLGHMPIIDSPFARVTEHWWTFQGGPCADAEMDLALCSERVGVRNTAKVCKQYHDDFMECAYRIKTLKRYNAMNEERKKQGRPYPPAPAPDSIRTWTRPY